ncbi:MAG: phosphodiester glycosidase family protein, partial [Clostridia bacterium]|nr:phosphodiester glycosidase family protein [Clostridia bacterium]
MVKKLPVKALSLIMAMIMLFGMLPMSVTAAGSVTNYADFLDEFKQLEAYAEAYYAENSAKSEGELVLNFVRTGVDRYLDGNWSTLAGQEITEFTAFVEAQDALNGTTVMNLRDIVIDDFILPNGNPSDFGHMFGTMNISYVNKSNTKTPDLSGWAGDLCDLLYYCAERENVTGSTVDEKAEYILENCFGVDADDAFGWDDFYGDMDAYYFINEYLKGNGKFSELFEAYFTAELDDSDRSAYFLNNRFPGKTTKQEVRDAVYDAYRLNVGIQVLEADRGISDYTELRKAACYAFADYLFSKADGRLEGGNEDDGGEEELPDNGYYSVFSSTDSILAPGVTQQINYAMSADGKQMVYYVATVDVNRDDLTIMANYNNNDPSKGWAMQRVQDQVAAMVKNHSHIENFRPVVAINGDGFNTSTGKPGGLLVMEGVEWHPVDGDGFFAILKDGTAMIGTQAEYQTYKSQIQEAIGAFGATLIKDGKIAINKNSQYYTSRASRTAIGIKADGSVVMMVLDGRQEPFSCGGSMEEIAQIMYEAGCVHAVNLDGGGSTTYMSKPEGSNEIKVVNRPSDGYARSVAATLVAVSTAKSSDEFDRAIIESDYDYLTVGTSLTLNAVGVNNIGSSAVIPAGAVWTVSDESIGTVTQDGVFTANDIGDVEVSLMLDGACVGSKTLHVVVPDNLEFEEDYINVVYGVPTKLPLKIYYKSNEVAYNANDVLLGINNDEAGIIDGLYFVADEGSKIRSAQIGAMIFLSENFEENPFDTINLSMFNADETNFDFNNATAGNRTLAWNREVLNATTTDGMNYSVVDPEKDVELGYTFALDMTAIEIPQQLQDIVFMLPGSDNAEISSSAFNYLLMLAERVSVLTEVKITAQFDKDVEVDVSELKIVNDYFELKKATVDENNTLTLVCNWIDRTESIDPATANPVCILTGIKAKPAADAKWDENELIVINTGTVSFDIYLRASSLYSFANKAENQQKYGLYPYTTNETGWEGGEEKGAHFADSYAEFED